jgi:peptide/nickel transport system substrate-binding protein
MFQYRWLLAIILLVTLVSSACGGAQSTPIVPPESTKPPDQAAPTQPLATLTASVPLSTQQPSILRIGRAGGPDTLNPGTAMLSEAYTIFELVYSALYEQKLDGSFVLDLAESVTTSADNLVWTYKIKSSVKFHDGIPLTAKDVAFSYNLYKAHEDFPYMNGYTGKFASVEATDDSTFVLTLSEPIPNIESQLTFLFILPEHIWSKLADAKAVVDYQNPEMIGSGPFKLVEYKQGEFVHVAKFADYFGDKPKVDEIVFQQFANQDALVQAIKTGQVDMITEMPNTSVATLKNDKNIKLVTGAPLAPDVTDILINQVSPENCPKEGGKCTGHPALRDLRVRQALAYATNKQELIDIVLLGLGAPGLTLIPDSLGPWFNNTIKDFPFDIAQANKVLDEAGYIDTNKDGVREMPDGKQSLIFRLNWPSDSTVAPRLAELVSKTWIQAGIKTQPQALDPDALTSVCCPTFDYDLAIWGWGSDPDPSFLLRVMLTAEIPTGMSETGYSNPEYDALFEQQAKEMDFTKRKEIVWKMEDLLHKDVVYIVPFYSKAVQAYRVDRFTGWLIDQPKLALEDVSSLVVVEGVK